MPQAQAPSLLASPIIMLLFIFAIFYLLVFRPQKKQEKERQKMLGNLVKNDEIVTSAGIHGTIVNIKDKTVIVRIDENTKVEMEKSCIVYVKKEPAKA